ncbi:hypothetical protein M8J76_009214 [Diaphorina citri]|nr:hypothetical protein M8J76_009214 [Diaphorina citri]
MLSKLSSLGSNPSTSVLTRSRYATSNLTHTTNALTRTTSSNTINTPSVSNHVNNNSSQIFNLSIPIASDFDHTASLLERINELENSNQRLLNSIEVLTRSLSLLQNERNRPCQCSVSGPPLRSPHTPRATSLTFKRIFIFADSMGRDISSHLRTLIGRNSGTRVISHLQPGASFKVIADSVPRMCPDLCQDDVVFVMGGTNDIPELDPDSPSAKALSYNSLIHLSSRTNIILNTIPYRYDELSFHSTNIFHTNCGILYQAKRNNLLSFDNSKFLHRQHFTQHGLHLNRSGKKLLAQKLFQFLSEFGGSVPLVDINQYTRVDSIIHLDSSESRGSHARPTSPSAPNSVGRIPALVPTSRSTPNSYKSNFTKKKSKRGT